MARLSAAYYFYLAIHFLAASLVVVHGDTNPADGACNQNLSSILFNLHASWWTTVLQNYEIAYVYMYIYRSNPWIEPWSFCNLLAFWSCLKTGSRSSMLDAIPLQIISISNAISPVEKPPQLTNPMSVEKVYLNLSIQCLLFESIVLRVSWLHM